MIKCEGILSQRLLRLYVLFFCIDDVEFEPLIIIAEPAPKQGAAAGVYGVCRSGQAEAQFAFVVEVQRMDVLRRNHAPVHIGAVFVDAQ